MEQFRRGTDLRVALEGFAVVGRERGGVLRLQQLTAALKEMGFTCVGRTVNQMQRSSKATFLGSMRTHVANNERHIVDRNFPA